LSSWAIANLLSAKGKEKARFHAETGFDDCSVCWSLDQCISRLRLLFERNRISPPRMAVFIIITEMASHLTMLIKILTRQQNNVNAQLTGFTVSRFCSNAVTTYAI
jgi:hypothetical protein